VDLRINRGATDHPLVFYLVQPGDHRTPATGLSPSPQISKNGGAWASPAGAVSELGHGWYQVAANSGDVNTVGSLLLHMPGGAGNDPCDVVYEVIPAAGVPPITQSTPGYLLRFLLISSADHLTGLTRATPAVLLRKTGQAFSSPVGPVVEVGFGWYGVQPAAGDLDTVGPLVLDYSATGADPGDERFDVAPLQLPSSGQFGNTPTLNVLKNRVNTFRLTVPDPDADGALQNAWTALAVNVPCSVQPGEPRREERQGAIRLVIPYELLFMTNPGLRVGDQAQWSDDLGAVHPITATGGRSLAGRGSAFLVTGEEVL
jgi:hypothetical protein